MKHFQCVMFLRRNSKFWILTWVSLEEARWETEHVTKVSFFYLKWQIVVKFVKAFHWESEGYWFKPNNVHNRAWGRKFVTRLLINFCLKKYQTRWLNWVTGGAPLTVAQSWLRGSHLEDKQWYKS